MNNENMSTQTQNEDNNTEQTRTFTQEEVNRMISERLSRVKTDEKQEYSAKLAELNQKEFRLQAKELLMAKNMPESLLEAINCSDIKEFNKSINIIEEYVKEASRPVFRGATIGRSNYDPVSGSVNPSTELKIRKAMGLEL